MKKVLLTGASGFIGSHVLERLRARKLPVRALVRNEAGLIRLRDAGWKAGKGLELIVGDLAERFAVPRLLEGCGQVIHAAGRVSSHPRDRQLLYRDNTLATAHLLDAALAASIKRFVYISCPLAVGAAEGEAPADESVTYDLSYLPGAYPQAIRVAELEALRTATRGLPMLFATPTFCLGPGDLHNSSSLFLGPRPAAIKLLPGGGLNIVDVRDAAEGIVRVLESGEIGERYLLGGANITFHELFQLVTRHFAALGQPSQLGKLRTKFPFFFLFPPPQPSRLGRLRTPLPLFFPFPPPLARTLAGFSERLLENPPLDRTRAALFGRYWYYRDARARATLEYSSRPLEETVRTTVEEWAARNATGD